MGAIFRTSDGCGIEKLYLCGYTGTPPRNEISKTALGAEKFVDWEYRKSSIKLIKNLKKKGYRIVALEKTNSSKCYFQVNFCFPVALVIGNEKTGVSDLILKSADLIAYIPMYGQKESLNVATAFGILAYKLVEKIREC